MKAWPTLKDVLDSDPPRPSVLSLERGEKIWAMGVGIEDPPGPPEAGQVERKGSLAVVVRVTAMSTARALSQQWLLLALIGTKEKEGIERKAATSCSAQQYWLLAVKAAMAKDFAVLPTSGLRCPRRGVVMKEVLTASREVLSWRMEQRQAMYSRRATTAARGQYFLLPPSSSASLPPFPSPYVDRAPNS